MESLQPVSHQSRQQKLIGVAHDLSRTENIDQLLDQILECSREVMDCEVCSILLPEEDMENLIIRSTLDFRDSPGRVPKGKGISWAVFESKEVINLRDAQEDPRHFAPVAKARGLVARAMVTIPLLDGDRALGVMQAINCNHRSAFDEADVEIFETFGSLISVTLIRLEAQNRAIRDAQRQHQMELAHEIQQSFLPKPCATLGDISIQAFYEPASQVGGDFYFWHPLPGDRILLGVADVCGKGFPAALDMARGSTLISSLAHHGGQLSLAEWVRMLNSRLCDVMSNGRFIASTFLMIDQTKRRVEVCVCGSLAPMVLQEQQWLEVVHQPNPPLGISCQVNYQADEFPLGIGRNWLLMTDGILETQNEHGEYFEDQAFNWILHGIATQPGCGVLDPLTQAWKEFARATVYQDDVTVLTLADGQATPPEAYEFSCRAETLKEAREFMEQWVRFVGFDDSTAGLVVLGCDEVFSNICKHAYCGDRGGPARCRVALAPDSHLDVVIEHHGEGVCNQAIPVGETPEMQVGGLGMYLIRDVFDDVNFEKSPEICRITLRKRLV